MKLQWAIQALPSGEVGGRSSRVALQLGKTHLNVIFPSMTLGILNKQQVYKLLYLLYLSIIGKCEGP